MIGAPAELVVSDAYQKGVTQFDAEAAYAILRAAAADAPAPMGGRGGRDHVEDYLRLGYVPSYVGGSVSWTTEYARGDYALGQLAQALGHPADAQQFAERSHNYRNLYDAGSGFLRARAGDGTFDWRAYDPTKYLDGYVEANGWQSLWMNDHDADGMVALLGGREPFVTKLNQMFEQTRSEWEAYDQAAPQFGSEQPSYYWPGNEPDIHAAYLFAQAGHPELTARWVRWLMATQFRDVAAGLPGNDDGGTMSAWYVFSALGIFPVAGSDHYVLGAPLFPRIEVALSSGPLTIEAPGVSAERPYVQAITLDGVPLSAATLRHSELRGGRTLHFTMGAQPPSAATLQR
jgi:predicted alpha-1,2-mannosidase